jgi:ABC-type histidine transport system ATPase subunit
MNRPDIRTNFHAVGATLMRDGQPFVRAATPIVALALELALNDGQLVFTGPTPVADQEFVREVLWS